MMKVCSIEGCGLPVKARGWCNKHWIRWMRHNDPTAGGYDRQSAKDFLFKEVIPYEGSDCLAWPFSSYSTGYGRIGLNGKRVVVSREVCRIIHGDPPAGNYDAAHSCGNGHLGCVNPNHLSWKTRSENHADKVMHDTHRRGVRSNLAKIDEETARAAKNLLSEGFTRRQVMERLGITRGIIDGIASGNSWNWL